MFVRIFNSFRTRAGYGPAMDAYLPPADPGMVEDARLKAVQAVRAIPAVRYAR